MSNMSLDDRSLVREMTLATVEAALRQGAGVQIHVEGDTADLSVIPAALVGEPDNRPRRMDGTPIG